MLLSVVRLKGVTEQTVSGQPLALNTSVNLPGTGRLTSGRAIPNLPARALPESSMTYRCPMSRALFALPSTICSTRRQPPRLHFTRMRWQVSTLLSIKTGGCSEDGGLLLAIGALPHRVDSEGLMPLSEVLASARVAKAKGATRFCMARPGAVRKKKICNRCWRWCAPSRRSAWKPAPRSAC